MTNTQRANHGDKSNQDRRVQHQIRQVTLRDARNTIIDNLLGAAICNTRRQACLMYRAMSRAV